MGAAPCIFCKRSHDFTREEAFQILRRTPDSLRLLLDAVNPEDLRRKKGKEWSPREILIHLVDTEFAYGFRYRAIMGKEGCQVSAYDQQEWAERFGYGELDGIQLVRAFTPLRRVNLELLQSVDPALFQRAGYHEEYGKITVGDMIPHIAAHDLNHLQQIRDRIPAV
jgi:DinB superfamily